MEMLIQWSRGRLIEWWSGNVAPASAGLPRIEATMAMAAARFDMGVMKKAIALGADPSVTNFLAYRMAAGAGDVEAMASIEALAAPSEYALKDALAWAHANGQWGAAARLRSRMAGAAA
jgi:hypothetical protein